MREKLSETLIRLKEIKKPETGVNFKSRIEAGSERIAKIERRQEAIIGRTIKRIDSITFSKKVKFKEKMPEISLKIASEIIPVNLTEAILLILSRWHISAANLLQKKIVFEKEVFNNGDWVFQNDFLGWALESEFLHFLDRYCDKKGQIDRKKMSSSLSAIIAQIKKPLVQLGFLTEIVELKKDKRKFFRVDSFSGNFSFACLKEIFKVRNNFPQDYQRKGTNLAFSVKKVRGKWTFFEITEDPLVIIAGGKKIEISPNGKILINEK